MRMKLVWVLLIGITCIFSATNLAAKSNAANGGNYTTKDKEFYLTPEQLLFIRPGLVIEILDVTIPADMQPEVTYTISDPEGLPLDHDGVYTPGPVDMRFTLANIPMGEEQKVRLTYERISRNGTLTQIALGKYHYKFDVVLASDQDTTHTLVLGGRRNLREFDLDRYADNDVQSWVPSGMYDAVPRDIVTTPTCNRCHDPLNEHGRWQSPQACSQCHNPTQNTRFDELIHAVHAATEAGGHDFSEILYPTDVEDCQVCHTGGIPTEAFPLVATPNPVEVCDMTGVGTALVEWGDVDAFEIHMDAADGPLFASASGNGSQETGKWVKNGTTFFMVDKASGETVQELVVNTSALGCLTNAPGTPRGEAGAQHTNWMDHPSRVVCGSCHNDIVWDTGEGHSDSNIPQLNDDRCGVCHKPDSGVEFDMSVKGAHQMLYSSAQFPGANVELLSVANTGPGQRPTVLFSAFSRDGALNPNTFNRVRFTLTGPNEDFDFRVQEDALGSAIPVDGNWAYTFEAPLPTDAVGSYTVAIEGRNEVDIDFGDEVSSERDVIPGALLEFAVTDTTAMARRTVMDDYNCESCHVNLALHGGGRTNANYCNTCHIPSLVDIATPSESVHMKWMIHKIHRGADLENGYIVVRNRGTYDFSHVEFPGDLRNCDVCHINNSQQLPIPSGALPTITEQTWWSPTRPEAAACLSCHDDDSSAAHAYSNTTFFGESCSTCHGEGKQYSVDKVHAQ